MAISLLFPTALWQSRLDDAALLAALSHSCRSLSHSCRSLAEDDAAGRRWCRAHHYRGYTSYASLNDLPMRDPAFATLARWLTRQASSFATAAHLDLGGRKPRLDSLWVNILKPGGGHSGHIHPHSIVSGTLYVDIPDGAGAIRFEDPRLPMFMHAPPRSADAPEAQRHFVHVAPVAGTLLLWESWLRHEVLTNGAKSERISISFNFA
ncbi:MAG: TIGR02466 family protein [Sandarakinorhabdus sp.]|nr:TIGR02466 family protein [Sandarakinorhabdus sp.]